MRLLLVDDHALFLQSLKALLTARGYTVVGTANDGIDALQQARLLHPDLILMDIQMPGCDGLTATRMIKTEMPQIKIVMLTISYSDEHLFDAIKSGACGYLLKSQNADKFLEMIAQVENGGVALPPELAAPLMDEFARMAQQIELAPSGGNNVVNAPVQLSDRQRGILALVAQGLTYVQVAEALHISEPTVRYHMTQILDHLHLANRSQVIAFAARHGLTSHDRL